MTISTRPHKGSLVFDGHELLAYRSHVPGRLWWFEALADDATLGNPAPVDEVFGAGSRDGSRVRRRGHDNREPSFQIVVVGVNGTALAEGERVLALACNRPTSLEWTPPSGLGATTRYQIQTAHTDWIFDDFDEMDEGNVGTIRRSYRLSMVAEPFGRSIDKVTLDFPAGVASPTLTLLDAMTSATGWASDASGSSSVTEGTVDSQTYLEVEWVTNNFDDVFLRKAGTLYACEDYVLVDRADTSSRPVLLVDGEAVSSIASTTVRQGTPSEAVRDVYYVGGGSHTLGMKWTSGGSWGGATPIGSGSAPLYSVSGSGSVRFFDINTSDDLPQGLARRLSVPGSARGPWTVRASDTGHVGPSGLGPTLIAIGPKVGQYNPLIHTGGVLGSSVSFVVPPGSYALIAVFFPPASYVDAEVVVNGVRTRIKTDDAIQALGRFSFGGGRGGRPGSETLTISVGGDLNGDLLLIPLDDDHSYVLGDYSGKTYLFCDPASLTESGGVFTGDEEDGADARPAYASSLITQPLDIEPGESSLYVYPIYADIQVSGFPYWLHNAGAVDA